MIFILKLENYIVEVSSGNIMNVLERYVIKFGFYIEIYLYVLNWERYDYFIFYLGFYNFKLLGKIYILEWLFWGYFLYGYGNKEFS